MAEIGKNILENLTTGMYTDSRVMYREYIQNACDAIDVAIKNGVLTCSDARSPHCDARIDVATNVAERRIEITDNGIGVPKDEFMRILSDIANSDKIRGEDKGFRGIGRLCGLAYCNQMLFVSTVKGEDVESTMTWDAKLMRTMLHDTVKRSVNEVLDKIITTTSTKTVGSEKHYFKVILNSITEESESLLDEHEIIKYLQFVAPVPYNANFMFVNHIYDHAKSLGFKIDEYRIFINDTQIFKEYNTQIYGKNSEVIDNISMPYFQDFYDDNDTLLGWLWCGISSFNGQIPDIPANPHRCLRLRKANIQIGTDETLRRFFKESNGRGIGYYVGEVFAAHRDLTPNSQRDYFNQNPCCLYFGESLRNCFQFTLEKLYHKAAQIRSEIKSKKEYTKAIEYFNKKAEIGFVSDAERETALEDLEEKRVKAEKSQAKIIEMSKVDVKETDNTDDITVALLKRVTHNVSTAESKRFNIDSPLPDLPPEIDDDIKTRPKYIIDDLSQFDRRTRKVIQRIYEIIIETEPKISEPLISKIQEGLKQKKNE